MQAESANKIKKEGMYMLICFVALFLIFKILFSKESFTVVLRTVLSLFWLFILPGFMLMYYWDDKLDFIERLIIGAALGFAIISVLGYNLGWMGIKMQYQLWIIPILSIVVGAFVLLKKKGAS